MEQPMEIDFSKRTSRVVHCNDDGMKIEVKTGNNENIENIENDNQMHTVCSYFITSGHCKFGNNCHNSHELGTQNISKNDQLEENVAEDLNIESQKTRNCKYFVTKIGCKLSERCPFKHYRSVSDAGVDEENTDIYPELQDELKTVVIKEEELEEQYGNHKILPTEDENNDFNNRNCKFFQTKEGCLNGNRCPYKHATLAEYEILARNLNEEQMSEEVHSKGLQPKGEVLCTFFSGKRGCLKKDCQFLHSSPLPYNKEVTSQEKEEDKNSGAYLIVDRKPFRLEIDVNDTDFPKTSLNQNKSKADTICRNFDSKRGCRKKKCPYMHRSSASSNKQAEPIEESASGQAETQPILNGSKEHVFQNDESNFDRKPIKPEIDGRDTDFPKTSLTQHKSRASTLCRNFDSERGCRNRKCPYMHPSSASSKKKAEAREQSALGRAETQRVLKDSIEHVYQDDESNVDQKPVRPEIDGHDKDFSKTSMNQNNSKANTLCRNFDSERGCRNRKCPYMHRSSSSSYKQAESREQSASRQAETQRILNDSKEHVYQDDESTRKQGQGRKVLPKSERLCKFYAHGGCTMDRKCPFLHEKRSEITDNSRGNIKKDDSKISDIVPVSENKVEHFSRYSKENESSLQATICKFYLTSRGCFKGDKCPFKHDKLDNRVQTNNSLQTEKSLETLQNIEFTQLEKRLKAGDKFNQIQDKPRIYHIIVSPTDPDWAFVIKQFKLEIEFPDEYPEKMFNLCLIEGENYPVGFQGFFNQQLDAWIEEREKTRNQQDLAFRPFLKWFDRNVKEIFVKSASMVKAQRDAKQAGIILIPHKNILQNKQDTETESTDQTNKDLAKEEVEPTQQLNNLSVDDTNDIIEMHHGNLLNDQSNLLSEKVKKGTEMKFIHLSLSENIGTLKLRRILLTVQCNRCKSRVDHNLQEKRISSVTCKKCSGMQSVTFYPELIHQFSPVVGYLHMDGCRAFDLILQDSELVLNCLNCSKDDIIKGISYVDKRYHWCHHCHTKMELQIQSIKFNQTQDMTGNVSTKKKDDSVKKKNVKDPGIRDGEPLPNNGTCKHYKKSYRWLRFPCCGKAYPCDICHEEGEENDHEMKFAAKMICGFCSKEQPFAKDKPCVRCNSNITRSKSTHWEGGKGCRDQTKMARGDNKKTTGVNKTISRKKANEK